MNKKILVYGSVALGVAFIAVAVMYWMVPAGSLSTFVPGYIAGSADIHFKHGLGSLILAIALFVFAWFKSAPTAK